MPGENIAVAVPVADPGHRQTARATEASSAETDSALADGGIGSILPIVEAGVADSRLPRISRSSAWRQSKDRRMLPFQQLIQTVRSAANCSSVLWSKLWLRLCCRSH